MLCFSFKVSIKLVVLVVLIKKVIKSQNLVLNLYINN